ncbi:tryptophan synthase beta subunit-like PLP-dependent enzyme [Punctularia strigosozonata HHB-11173 SS5]|uniref:tryptophan synthase beta subunit-like PLP-dependent enzyme n=1 Tax=Punctularia strigosozonata (strain HHB-11173) TaxID=741275 RepID=UPI0004418514|nr:tryptophan synthase beta subunit-like PLP-dependent enzyme [Punctularia strigosozonata HHB-11173 SS5]EIN14475.1 tryptophan synthase beta subunit-like PLP-dependent enzyme [Punctularia strigosozonata HHB-11173 SS5]
MRYFSTRGGDAELSFEEAVLTGLAPDGGLYIPDHVPQLPSSWQEDWASHSFADLAVAVLSLYISEDEINRDELRSLVEKSYSTFRHPDVTPLKQLDDETYILELFHGPTFAFKDVALQLLGNLFEFFLKRRNARKSAGEAEERLTVVGATSGDTGSAAIYGLRGKANVSIFILHPKGRVSPVQEAQMTTVTDTNVHNVAIKGTFDDCQDIVKALFGDRHFNAAHRLGAVNSINWARILAQTVYYFLSYFHVRRQISAPASADIKLEYVVPTGNFGDILAGYYAKRMGLPIRRLVVATNANDILARFWKSGRYEKVDADAVDDGIAEPAHGASDGKQTVSGGVKETLSPAMDILVSSNFERLLWYLAYESVVGRHATEIGKVDGPSAVEKTKRREACHIVQGWMSKVKSDGRVEVPVTVLEAARRDFAAERVSDELTLKTIRERFDGEPSYVADPHTAVALAAAKIVKSTSAPNTVQIVLSTAHPAKFSEAVTKALAGVSRHATREFNFERDVLPDEFRGLLDKERRVINVERPDVEEVKRVIERFAQATEAAPNDFGCAV